MTAPTAARWIGLPVAVLAVSTSGILIRLTAAPPLVTATYRLVWAAVILLAIAALTRRRELSALNRVQVGLLALSGILLGFHFALWTSSLFWTSVASAVLLTDTHPAFDALGARFFLAEATPPGVWLGIAATFVGTLVIAGGDIAVGERALIGDLMAIGASATMAGYLIIGRSVRQDLSTVSYAGCVYALAGLCTGIMAFVAGSSLLDITPHDAVIWLALVALPTLLGHTVFNWALRYVAVSVVGVVIVGEPVVTMVWAWLLLDEAPSTSALVGGAIALAGIYLALRTRPAADGAAERQTEHDGQMPGEGIGDQSNLRG
jgi:drug/metabolite transporter (DMT)-like permease